MHKTHGKHPKPRLASLVPLPAGITSDCEVLLVAVEGPVNPAEVPARVNPHLPDGLRIESAWSLPPGQAPPPPTLFARAEYEFHFGDTTSRAALEQHVAAFLARDDVRVPRRPTPTAPKVNVRPLVTALQVQDGHDGLTVVACLPLRTPDSIHPAQVAIALGISADGSLRIHRRAMLADMPREFRPFPLERRPTNG